ncbi:MAG: hypothetical protein WCA15_15060 [Candidatus Acidiferrales bacterium]
MVSGSGFGVVGSYQCYGAEGDHVPPAWCDGEYQRTNASYTVVAGQHQCTDAAYTVGEHQRTDAANALGQHERADAAYTVGEHQRSNAADALEIS